MNKNTLLYVGCCHTDRYCNTIDYGNSRLLFRLQIYRYDKDDGGDRCFGILADMDFIIICTYEKDGENPELLIYKKRY